jgi:hypothetical protein
LMLVRVRHDGCQATQERQVIHLDGDGAIAERPLELQADQIVGEKLDVLVGDGGTKHVFAQSFAGTVVQGAGGGGGVERKAELRDRQRGLNLDAWASWQRDDNGTAALGAGRGKPGDGSGGELGQGGLFVGQLARDHGGIVADVDDSPSCEQAQDAGADDLEQVGHLVGAKAGQRAEGGDAITVGDENAVEEIPWMWGLSRRSADALCNARTAPLWPCSTPRAAMRRRYQPRTESANTRHTAPVNLPS